MAGFTINYTIGDTKFLWVTISTPYNDGTGRIWRGNGILNTGSSSSAIVGLYGAKNISWC